MRTLRLASANLQDGIVDFVGGKLYVADPVNGATLRAMNCGQWEGHGASNFEVSDGARITIAGKSAGDVGVRDEGEFRFGPEFIVPEGKALTLIGGGCRAGGGVLNLHGALELLAVDGVLPRVTGSGVVRLHPGFTITGNLTTGHAITGDSVQVENHGANLPASVTLAGDA